MKNTGNRFLNEWAKEFTKPEAKSKALENKKKGVAKKMLSSAYKYAKEHNLGRIDRNIKAFRRHFERTEGKVKEAHKVKTIKFY